MDSELAGRICTIVADHLGVDVREVTPEANILDDLGADSLDVVELVMSLEDAFDIQVDDEEVEAMRTIRDIQQFVIAHVA
jgi:acyl carrier protein